jgi:alcohol-forming fatty acyl-CoA reductase
MREINIEESYSKKKVLVSGATGFVGKVVTEKLLRDCDGIDKIFILLRSKKGDGIEKRFESFKNHDIFKFLKKNNPSVFDKLAVIEGDLLADKLGISAKDEEIIVNNVNVIIHCAATVKFDEPVKIALKMNTISTRDMLNLAEKCVNFNAFVHVSTAYSNTNQKVICEKIYEPICDYKEVISLVEQNKDEELTEIEASALKTFPNTYVFTKHLTEKLVSEYGHLPITIVRPSIVCPSSKEPYEGWVSERKIKNCFRYSL